MKRAYRVRVPIEVTIEAEGLEGAQAFAAELRGRLEQAQQGIEDCVVGELEIEPVVGVDWLPPELRRAARRAGWAPMHKIAVAGRWASDRIVALRVSSQWAPAGVLSLEEFGEPVPELGEVIPLGSGGFSGGLRPADAPKGCEPEYLELIARAFPGARAYVRAHNIAPDGRPWFSARVYFFQGSLCVAILAQTVPGAR